VYPFTTAERVSDFANCLQSDVITRRTPNPFLPFGSCAEAYTYSLDDVQSCILKFDEEILSNSNKLAICYQTNMFMLKHGMIQTHCCRLQTIAKVFIRPSSVIEASADRARRSPETWQHSANSWSLSCLKNFFMQQHWPPLKVTSTFRSLRIVY